MNSAASNRKAADGLLILPVMASDSAKFKIDMMQIVDPKNTTGGGTAQRGIQ